MRFNPQKHRLPMFPHSGILLADKPTDWTSHDLVNYVRVRFNVPKVGHCGTLDPAATGLLVLLLGHATKLSQGLSQADKTYAGTIRFGIETDSQDMAGEILAEHDWSALTPEVVRAEFGRFLGEQEQIPPMVSAKKQDGKRLYELARQGQTVVREPKPIVIHEVEVGEIRLPDADFTVRCSKGTYIRTLCFDIGRNLGCGAVLLALRRLASGDFQIRDAVTPDAMRDWTQDDLYRALQGF
jgi:tRNA pseudouridine55 synthase